MVQKDELRRVFSLFATGVTVVTARDGAGEPVGVTANSVTSVSLEPPMMLWCLANQSQHLHAFTEGAAFAIHVLAEHQGDTALKFARKGALKFDEGAAASPDAAPPAVDDALARIDCRVVARHAAGDHMIIVGGVHAFMSSDGPPLVFHKSRFGRFIPGPDN